MNTVLTSPTAARSICMRPLLQHPRTLIPVACSLVGEWLVEYPRFMRLRMMGDQSRLFEFRSTHPYSLSRCAEGHPDQNNFQDSPLSIDGQPRVFNQFNLIHCSPLHDRESRRDLDSRPERRLTGTAWYAAPWLYSCV